MFGLGRLLSVLRSHGVDFFVVGGGAAALQGAPVLTQDVDILYLLDEDNVQRLKRAMDELNAIARDDPRDLRFDARSPEGCGHASRPRSDASRARAPLMGDAVGLDAG